MITARALADMLRIQRFGEPPVLLRPDPVWRDPEAERAAADRAWRAFDRAGLAGRRGLDPDARDALRVLVRPETRYSAVMLGPNSREAAVVAARGADTVIAYRAADTVTLRALRRVSPAESLLRQIPDARPAPIGSVNIRVSDIAEAGAIDPFDESPRSRDARTVAHLRTRPLIGQGELGLVLLDAYGRRRGFGPLRYQDYDIGRVLVTTANGYLSLTGITKVQLRNRLRDAHHELADS